MGSDRDLITGVGKENTLVGVDLARRKTVSSEDSVKKAATDFEALLLHQMFSEMWKGGGIGQDLLGSQEQEMYQDMLTDEVAKTVAQEQSLGMTDLFVKEMVKRNNGK